jgi:hypothetical protein
MGLSVQDELDALRRCHLINVSFHDTLQVDFLGLRVRSALEARDDRVREPVQGRAVVAVHRRASDGRTLKALAELLT